MVLLFNVFSMFNTPINFHGNECAPSQSWSHSWIARLVDLGVASAFLVRECRCHRGLEAALECLGIIRALVELIRNVGTAEDQLVDLEGTHVNALIGVRRLGALGEAAVRQSRKHTEWSSIT